MDDKKNNPSNNALSIMIVGGGSGGHVTPLLAVATALKKMHPKSRLTVVGRKGENLQEVIEDDSINEVFLISAGKFRRYHGESFLTHILDFKTVLLNFRDFFRVIAGIFQAWHLLRKERPSSIMLKGGFVSVPVGVAARWLKIPYITHDSDAIPGLANRLTAKHAVYNTTALPTEAYPYDSSKAIQVGIPLRQEFSKVSKEDAAEFKKELGINPKDRVLFCMGGGLGAQRLNKSVASISKSLLKRYPELEIIHVSGKSLFEETKKLYHQQLQEDLYNRVRIMDFSNDLYKLSGAADVIVSRAGATSIAEFALQAKPCVILPNPLLTGGQQTQNAKVLSDNEAAVIIDEDDSGALERAVYDLLDSPKKCSDLSEKLHRLSQDDSSKKIAELLVKIAN